MHLRPIGCQAGAGTTIQAVPDGQLPNECCAVLWARKGVLLGSSAHGHQVVVRECPNHPCPALAALKALGAWLYAGRCSGDCVRHSSTQPCVSISPHQLPQVVVEVQAQENVLPGPCALQVLQAGLQMETASTDVRLTGAGVPIACW